MNPHHPGHSTGYPHHPSLSSSPHHPGPGGPHHGYGSGGSGTTTTPDLPSPHSPPHGGGAGDPGTPYATLQPGQGMGSNGHHHGSGMMPDHPHHPGHPHPHMPGHPAYPPVNHNNNCTLKQEGVPSGSASRNCAGCGVQIVERWLLLAMDRYWHIGCLKCSCCHVVLGEVAQSCYLKGGLIFCKADYKRMFGSGGICSSCGNPIPPNELVMRAADSVFHLKCFNCNKCGSQLVAGDRYYLLSGSPVCETDWHKFMKSSNVAAAAAAAGNSGAPVRKGKVGRPRRSRE